MDLTHLVGLRRLSPCCETRVGHPIPLDDDANKDPIRMICLKCRRDVSEHILVNAAGDKVWPVDGTGLEPLPKRKRRRRVAEGEPLPYPLHLTDGLAILRRKK